MRSKFLPQQILFLLLSFATSGIAQTHKVVPPAPNAMKMTEFQAQQPGLYTGTANVSIPIHTINFDGFELPVSISYHATGIRTTEEASEVGLGWSLNATGIISRTIRGGDDLFEGDVQGISKGYVYNTQAVTHDLGYDRFTQYTVPQNSYYHYLAFDNPDTEPDIFNYNFFGYAGSFVLSQKVATGGVINVIKLTEDATSITYNEPYKYFTIITPEGFKGEFKVKEKSTSMSGVREATDKTAACGENFIDHLYLKNESGRLRTTTSWYLTKIKSPRNQQITFSYFIESDSTSKYISNSRTFGEDEFLAQLPQCMQTVHEHIYVKSIDYPDNVHLEFQMEKRDDQRKNNLFTPASAAIQFFPFGNDLQRYTDITITGLGPGSTLNKTVSFTQNYFNQQYHSICADNENELVWLRSRLDAVTIDDQEYRFNYYEGSKGLPHKHTRGVDHFGFYNGNDQNQSLMYPQMESAYQPSACDYFDENTHFNYSPYPDRIANFSFAQAGLLKQVFYPTSGYSQFEYESHSYVPATGNTLTETGAGSGLGGGARIKSIKEFDATGAIARHRYYRYNKLGDGSTVSTGVLMTPLLNLGKLPFYHYGHTVNGHQEVWSACNHVLYSNSSIPGNNAAEGKTIGYSIVHEWVTDQDGDYKNSYYFENSPNVVLDFPVASEGFQQVNGQVKEIRNYNSAAKIVQRVENTDYVHTPQITPTVKGLAYFDSGPDTFNHLTYSQPYEIPRSFTKPFTVITTVAQSPSEIVEDLNGTITSVGNSLLTATTTSYSSNYLLASEESIDSQGNILRSEFKRPLDYASPSSTLVYMKRADINIVSPVIEQITKKNGAVISATANRYELQGSLVNLTATYEFNRSLGAFSQSTNGFTFPTVYEAKANYTLYNTAGKLLEYKLADGLTNSFIWDYNGQLPIVEARGVGYTQLNAAYTAAVGTGTYETSLRSHANTVNAVVTTYEHDPQIGILKVTDAVGSKKTFEYDQFGRLILSRNNDGSISNQVKYHFKKRQPTRILTVSGTLNFGSFTSCNMPLPQNLALTNNGEDYLHIDYVQLPNGFRTNWCGGDIAPNSSINVLVEFVGATPMTYSGSISIGSNRTNSSDPITITASAIYNPSGTTRTMARSASSLTFDVTFIYKYVTITNSGNDCLYIDGLTNSNELHWYASVPAGNLAPGASTTMAIMLKTLSNPSPASITINSYNFNGPVGTNVIQVSKASYVMGISPLSFSMPSFTAASSTSNVTVSNNGTSSLSVTGFSSTDSRFSISPTSFTIPANSQQTIIVTYTPTDFVQRTGTISLNSNAGSGSTSFSVTAQRAVSYQLSLYSTSLNVTPFNSPVGTTLTNVGNQNVTINSANNSAPSLFSISYQLNNGTPSPITLPYTLQPGEQILIKVAYVGTGNGTLTLYTNQGGPYTLTLYGYTQ
jgi:YD repeat-containing protein